MRAYIKKSLRPVLRRRNGSTILEILVILMVVSTVAAVSVHNVPLGAFEREVSDVAFMNRLKGAITGQRIRAVKEPGIAYDFILDGSGSVRFQRKGSLYLKLDDPTYRVYVQPGAWCKVLTLWGFTNRTLQGTDGFTISVYKNSRLLGKLIFQVTTSTFREEFYGS